MEISIPDYRVATMKDIDDIISLWNESRIYHEELDSRLSMVNDAHTKVQNYYQEQLQSEKTIFYLATQKNDAVGYICAQLQNTPPVFKHSQIGLIDGLFVKSDYRRRGIGKKLVDLAMEWLRDKKIDRVQLSVAAMNQAGIDFWKNCGFKELAYRMVMLI